MRICFALGSLAAAFGIVVGVESVTGGLGNPWDGLFGITVGICWWAVVLTIRVRP